MIDPDKRKAVFTLHQEGMAAREISQRLNISRNTVAVIIRQQGQCLPKQRRDKIEVDLELLRRLYRECDGWAQRIHEKLTEEHGVAIGYSTLTRLLQHHGLGTANSSRCDSVPDSPGEEMQHDTSVYQVPLGDQRTRVIASLLYLRYSKRRYLRFYRSFNRFAMKCFLHEALMFWGYSARLCVIDNTNLARWKGTGKRAIIVPEMVTFSRTYDFEFICHALGHPNRKAGEERSFWTLETNFLPGRQFASLEDLNQQARQWATERMEQRPMGKSGLIPAKLFEHERGYLNELNEHLCPPYQSDERDTDQYGFIAFNGNYFWVPGTGRETVKVLHYANRVKICLRGSILAEYPLPADDVKNQKFSPTGQPAPRHGPKNRKHDSQPEEQRLRNLGPEVAAYLEFAGKTPGIQRHRFTYQLFALSRQLTATVFLETVRRALRYRITDLAVVERIAWLCTTQGQPWTPDVEVDDNYRQRPAYLEGRITDAPDLSIYDQLGQEDETSSKDQPTAPEQVTAPEQAAAHEQSTAPEPATESEPTTTAEPAIEPNQRPSSTDGEVPHG
jgi:transposase